MMRCESATTIVIFGASGDLTWRKLVPALYNNFKKGRLVECTHIVGFARRPLTNDSFRAHLREGAAQFSAGTFDPAKWEDFARLINYFQGNLDVPEDFPKLQAFLQTLEHEPDSGGAPAGQDAIGRQQVQHAGEQPRSSRTRRMIWLSRTISLPSSR